MCVSEMRTETKVEAEGNEVCLCSSLVNPKHDKKLGIQLRVSLVFVNCNQSMNRYLEGSTARVPGPQFWRQEEWRVWI